MKIHSVGAELFRGDRSMAEHTDGHDEANNHFSQFFEGAIYSCKEYYSTHIQRNRVDYRDVNDSVPLVMSGT